MPDRLCICGCGLPATDRYSYSRKAHKKRPVPKPELPDPNPSGLCQCGCNGVTGIAKNTYAAKGYFKGRHTMFLPGHGGRLKFAEQTSQWRGGRILTDQGYVKVRVRPARGAGKSKSYRYEHRVVMERMLGRPLAVNEQVHHINGDKTDNRPENLELWHRSQPNGVRREDYHCPGCCCPK